MWRENHQFDGESFVCLCFRTCCQSHTHGVFNIWTHTHTLTTTWGEGAQVQGYVDLSIALTDRTGKVQTQWELFQSVVWGSSPANFKHTLSLCFSAEALRTWRRKKKKQRPGLILPGQGQGGRLEAYEACFQMYVFALVAPGNRREAVWSVHLQTSGRNRWIWLTSKCYHILRWEKFFF